MCCVCTSRSWNRKSGGHKKDTRRGGERWKERPNAKELVANFKASLHFGPRGMRERSWRKRTRCVCNGECVRVKGKGEKEDNKLLRRHLVPLVFLLFHLCVLGREEKRKGGEREGPHARRETRSEKGGSCGSSLNVHEVNKERKAERE